jgi:hypothetical protein
MFGSTFAARLASDQDDAQFLNAKMATAAFVENLLLQPWALRDSIEQASASSLYALSDEQVALRG